MIESSRRHGFYDPRWNANGSKVHVQAAATGDRGKSIQRWENEGGRNAAPEVERPTRLDWYAFSDRYFAGRRRHDFEALTAYAAYC